MRLQEVLRERESEITVLEQSLKESQQNGQEQMVDPVTNGVDANHAEDGDDQASNPEPVHCRQEPLNYFESTRRTMENGHVDAVSSQNEDEFVELLNELILYAVGSSLNLK